MSGLTVGRTYTLSAWVYVPAGSPDVRAWIGTGEVGAVVTAKDRWVQTSVTFTASTTGIAAGVLNRSAAVRGDDRVYVDSVTLTEGDQPLTFADTPDYIGTGVPRVAVTGLTESYPIAGRYDASITLVEVG